MLTIPSILYLLGIFFARNHLISYRNIAGYSGWIPNYGSIHIYSNNPNLTIHLNFAEDVAKDYLKQIKEVIKEQASS